MSPARYARRVPALLALGVLVVLVGWTVAAEGSSAIRVALLESMQTVELQGSDIEVRPLAGTDRGGWRTGLVRAVSTDSAIAIGRRQAPGFHLR